jgi:hypothetical protein
MFIVALVVIVACLALAVDAANLWQARVELRNAADAVVLAAAQGLVDDDLLKDEDGMMSLVAERSRDGGIAYGLANPVLGRPLEVLNNPQNDSDGDIVFGYIPDPTTRLFQPGSDLSDEHMNAVRVVARRTRERGNPAGMLFARFFDLASADVVASATALLDRDVIGFRPIGRQPLPLAPLALLTDPAMSEPDCWEAQVELPILARSGQGVDDFIHDRSNRHFLEVGSEVGEGDGIYEMEVLIPLEGQTHLAADVQRANGCFLLIGGQDWETVGRQLAGGVTAADLAEMDGQFVLGWDNRMYLPGIPAAPGIDSQQLGTLLNAMKTLQLTAEPRIWPLFKTVVAGDKSEATVVVQGFVAARLVKAGVVTVGEKKEDQRQQLSLILQPCMMSCGTAVTDFARRHSNPEVRIHNRYICKVRLVE